MTVVVVTGSVTNDKQQTTISLSRLKLFLQPTANDTQPYDSDDGMAKTNNNNGNNSDRGTDININ